MRRKVELQIITEAIERLIPSAAPACLTVTVTEKLPGTAGHDGEPHKHTWTGTPAGLAERICTRLFGRPDTTEPLSPLAQADEAKRARDIVGEVGALTDGYAQLTTAPWYPVRPGDLVHVHYEGHRQSAPWGETYAVGAAEFGMLSLQPIASTLPDTEWSGAGCYATEDSVDPLADMWMEAGSHRLTIVRDGRPVHIGGAR